MSIAAQILDQRIRHAAQVMRIRLEAALGVEASNNPKQIEKDQHRIHSAALAVLAMKAAMGLDDSDAIDAIVDGGNDFGVDAVHWSRPTGSIFRVALIQSKLAKRLDGASNFEENGVIKMIDASQTLLDANADFTGNPRLLHKVNEIRRLVADGHIPTVTIILVNNGKKWTTAAQKRINNARLGDQVEWVHIGAQEMIRLMQPQASIDATLRLIGKYMVEEFSFRRALVGRIAAGELANLFAEHGDQLLERNVRRFLGMGDSRINQRIAATLKDADEQPNFYFYNNGITIVCRKFRHHALQAQDTTVQLEGMQIINGGQTSQVIARVINEMNEGYGASVLLRIYELGEHDEQVVNNITYATNSQNPVTLSDLKANDSKQVQLEQSIINLGYLYRRKRSDSPISDKEVTSTEVARAVLSVWLKQTDRHVAESDLFGTLYDQIFSDDLNGSQAIVAVMIMRIVAQNQNDREEFNALPFQILNMSFTHDAPILIGQAVTAQFCGGNYKGINHGNFFSIVSHLTAKGQELYEDSKRQYRTNMKIKFKAMVESQTDERIKEMIQGILENYETNDDA